ncbi:hypothetical protein [Candidatus Thiodiazotropha sp. CDECU1]|uniref:hypothetical protein n=1 Tax=Candidatus Thiodiazotropha sp. CDECU1 TaxID=3065865 RepID=UPI00292DC079|nr:hypothetical protein [Candidatus Thiodiazotropha sp. CDECU1]
MRAADSAHDQEFNNDWWSVMRLLRVIGEAADIQLEFSQKSEPTCSVNRLWLLASEGFLNCGEQNPKPSLDVEADTRSVKTALLDPLQTRAKVINLNRLASNYLAQKSLPTSRSGEQS